MKRMNHVNDYILNKEMEIVMAKRADKNKWALFLLVLAGIIIGSFLSKITGDISALSWLRYGRNFGLTSPLVLDLGILAVTFAFTIKITIGSLIGIAIAIIVYHFL